MSLDAMVIPLLTLAVALISLFTSGDKLRNRPVLYGLLVLNLGLCGFGLYSRFTATKSKQDDNKKIENLSLSLANVSGTLAAFKSETTESFEWLRNVLAGMGWSRNRPLDLKAAAASLVADKTRTELAARAPVASRRDVTIQYFPKDVDGDVVERSLRALGFELRRGSTQVPDVPTNALWFGSGVSLDDVKLAALTLMRAGVQLRAVRLFRSPGGAHEHLIQIGADRAVTGRPVLTVEQVASATGFPRSD